MGAGGWAVGLAFSGFSVGMWLAHVGFVFHAVPITRRVSFFSSCTFIKTDHILYI